MITEVANIRSIIYEYREDLAFIIGNGVNRFAYHEKSGISWNDILLSLWQHYAQNSPHFNEMPNGISNIEFYNLLELCADKSKTIKMDLSDIITRWVPETYHSHLQSALRSLDVPVLTTNYDHNLDTNMNLYKMACNHKFSDYYPWNCYYSDRELSEPISGFSVWHINGMTEYPRSIRISLTEYTNLSVKVHTYLHNSGLYDDFNCKNQNYWNGYNTWLHIIFNKSLCIFGLGLNEDEIFLRWLLIERAKYYHIFPDRIKNGWYVCIGNDLSKGKELFLQYIGFEVVKLNTYDDIYRSMLSIV